jgi:NAD(P)H-dependent FMN reductase
MSEQRLLFVTGSTRTRSVHTAAVRTACELMPERAMAFEDLISLPSYETLGDWAARRPEVVELRDAIAAAHIVVFCTPEYGGRLPDSLTNLLRWAGRGGAMLGKPTTWVNVAVEQADITDAVLASTLRRMGAAVLASCGVCVPVSPDVVSADGVITESATRERLANALQTVAALPLAA